MDAPSEIYPKQLDELHISVKSQTTNPKSQTNSKSKKLNPKAKKSKK